MAAVISSIKESEAIVAVVDSQDNPKEALNMFQPGDTWSGPPMAVLLNKSDLCSPDQLASLEAWYKDNCKAEAVFLGSAKEGLGVEAVKAWAAGKLPEGPTLYPKDTVSEQPERFFVSECVREQIFLHYEQEVPYCTQVGSGTGGTLPHVLVLLSIQHLVHSSLFVCFVRYDLHASCQLSLLCSAVHMLVMHSLWVENAHLPQPAGYQPACMIIHCTTHLRALQQTLLTLLRLHGGKASWPLCKTCAYHSWCHHACPSTAHLDHACFLRL